MIDAQVVLNGLVLGGLYACVAVGFSLVWGVLNVINLLHGSLIVLGAYLAYWAFSSLGLHPFLALPLVALILFALGYLLQRYVINPVMAAPVLITLVLTFRPIAVWQASILKAQNSPARRQDSRTVGDARRCRRHPDDRARCRNDRAWARLN